MVRDSRTARKTVTATWHRLIAMATKKKTLARLLGGGSDVSLSFEDVRSVLLLLGCTERVPAGSSHYTFSHPAAREILTIPRHKPLKPVYVRKARAFIVDNRLTPDGDS